MTGAPGPERRALHDVYQLFTRQYGVGPSVVASAPGRVNLIGEHTDYNGGDVLPIGIHLRTYVALGRKGPGDSPAVSLDEAELAQIRRRPEQPRGNWGDYLAGVVWALQRQGAEVPPLKIAVAGEVPVGSGLSSSAALEVAFAFGVAELLELAIDDRDLALIAWRAESEFVGVPCGIMDQFASALAQNRQALHIRAAQMTADLIPFAESVLIFDTAAPRSLRNSQFATRQAECAQALQAVRRVNPSVQHLAAASAEDVATAGLEEPLRRRALHVIEEQERVTHTVRALREGGAIPGELLYRSHESLRVQYECSSPELDWFVEHAAVRAGVRGARMTGAGWGGCALAVGDGGALADAVPALESAYEQRFGRRPATWIAAAEQGARIELSGSARGKKG